MITADNTLGRPPGGMLSFLCARVLPHYRKRVILRFVNARGIPCTLASLHQVTDNAECVAAIEKLRSSSNKNVGKAAAGAIWEMRGEETHQQCAATDKTENSKQPKRVMEAVKTEEKQQQQPVGTGEALHWIFLIIYSGRTLIWFSDN